MDNKYEGYMVSSGPSNIRKEKEDKIRYEGEAKKAKTITDFGNAERMAKKEKDEYYYNCDKVVTAITLIGIFSTVVVCTAIGGFGGFLTGLLIGFGIFIVFLFVDIAILGTISENRYRKSVTTLEMERDTKIKEIDEKISHRIKSVIMQYDIDVKETYQKVMANPSNIEPMVDYSVEMFKRMISHADSDSSKKFIECIFTFVVTTEAVKYKYESDYFNPRDDFNFEKQRFRNLHYEYECEGLAIALAQSVSNKMKMIYPPNTLNIEIRNEDSKVMMNFKAPNANFVVARDIF